MLSSTVSRQAIGVPAASRNVAANVFKKKVRHFADALWLWRVAAEWPRYGRQVVFDVFEHAELYVLSPT